MAAKTDPVAWLKALTRAALPGTMTVRLVVDMPEKGRKRVQLICISEDGSEITDPRDEDILQAVLTPFEALCAREKMPLTVELNFSENSLDFENPRRKT